MPHVFDPVPQLLKNVRYEDGDPLESAEVQSIIADAEAELVGRDRLVIRKSGTEPLVRVMAESDDAAQVERVVDEICKAVRKGARWRTNRRGSIVGFGEALRASIGKTLFAMLVSTGILSVLVEPKVTLRLGPWVCEDGETMASYSSSRSGGNEG